jgi:hypothetical protein
MTAEPETEEPRTEIPQPATVPGRADVTLLASSLLASSLLQAGDQCVAIPLHEGSSYVWWSLSPASASRVTSDAFFFVRALILQPSWDGPEQEVRDTVCDPGAGELLLHRLPRGAVVRVAVGTMEAGVFVPLAHSPALELAAGSLVQQTLEGATPVALEDPRLVSIATAARRAARVAEHS